MFGVAKKSWSQTVLVLENIFWFCTSFLFLSVLLLCEALTVDSFSGGVSIMGWPFQHFKIPLKNLYRYFFYIRQVILSKGQIDCNICMYNKHEYSHNYKTCSSKCFIERLLHYAENSSAKCQCYTHIFCSRGVERTCIMFQETLPWHQLSREGSIS